MTTDGGLSQLFRKHLPDVDFARIETWSTGQGVPDVNGCCEGAEFWIEMKATSGRAVTISPEQVAWAERRLRHGGRVFLAVRRQHDGGPRKGPAVDELWLFTGAQTRWIATEGLPSDHFWFWAGGPRSWDWGEIKRILLHFSFLSLPERVSEEA